MLVSSVLFGFAALLGSCVAADKDLGSVLSGHKNLTTYYKLIQVCIVGGVFTTELTPEHLLMMSPLAISRYPVTAS